ncbi:hypothetical protein [Altererythrobacter sp. ZODW24]|uniref:hypothetical protein n=1 Tax=Altererythrobacter sp. ZODW24 TaxID=2185142 RepID=UPI000DF75DC0|nr:hypothetical protein [Altererythrobacter sp. ZODW24]
MGLKQTAIIAVFAAIPLAGCAALQPSAPAETCATASKIGQFDPARDLLIANYDSKPDVDDLQAVAALGTVLRDPAFSCVNYIATAGAYGTQDGDFLPAKLLFDLSFGENWVDAHADQNVAVLALTEKAKLTIAGGGQVWITEAGQSDVTAKVLMKLPAELRGKVHVVQHSDWNESVTTPAALAFAKTEANYHKIADGNFPDNGTPAYNTPDGSAWAQLLAHPEHGAAWAEARRLSLKHNGFSGYDNPAVKAGGLDFSDTVEAAWIFGFVDMAGVQDFADRFSPKQ